MVRLIAVVVIVTLITITIAADPNVHYQAHTTFFGDHPTPIVNMYVGRDSRQLNLVLELARPTYLSQHNYTNDQSMGKTFFFGHPTVYLLPSRNRKIHYSDTFHESAIPGASSIELYSEGTFRNLHAEIVGSYREMPKISPSALSPPKPPASLNYVSNGYHYVSGLLRIDGALFLDPEALTWQRFNGFVLEHSQLNLISLNTPVEPIMTQINPLRIPCNPSILETDTTVNVQTFQDFCSFEVRWPVTQGRYVLTFDMRKPFSYLPEEIYRHYYSKNERKSDVDSYLAVEVGEDREVLVLPPVKGPEISYTRQRTAGLTPTITLGRDAIFFYRDVFGLQMHPTRELLIAAPHPYQPSVNLGVKSDAAIVASSVFHVAFFVFALVAHYIFRGPTTNLLTRIGSFNSYDKHELRIETVFQIATAACLLGFTILTIVSPWRVHGPAFIIGTIGAGIHFLLLCLIIAYAPIPLAMRLGCMPYYSKRDQINVPAAPLEEPAPQRSSLFSFDISPVRKRRSIFTTNATRVPLMSDVHTKDLAKKEEEKEREAPTTGTCCLRETSKIYDSCSPYVYWIDDMPHVYYRSMILEFVRSMINVNSTIFIMLLFSLSYEFKFAFFATIMLTQLLSISNVVYMVQSAIAVRWFSYIRRTFDSLSVSITMFYGTGLILYYGIAGNILLYQQLLEANSFYASDSVPIEIVVLINVAGVLYATFTFYNHIQSLISNFSIIKLDRPDPKVNIEKLSAHIK